MVAQQRALETGESPEYQAEHSYGEDKEPLAACNTNQGQYQADCNNCNMKNDCLTYQGVSKISSFWARKCSTILLIHLFKLLSLSVIKINMFISSSICICAYMLMYTPPPPPKWNKKYKEVALLVKCWGTHPRDLLISG